MPVTQSPPEPERHLMERILSAIGWITLVLVVIVCFLYVGVVWRFLAPFDPGRCHAGRAFRQLAVATVTLNPLWHFETDGPTPTNPRNPYVAVSNHESYADIFLISHFPWEMKWLSKDTLFKIPVYGWPMPVARDTPIKLCNGGGSFSPLAGGRHPLATPVGSRHFP